MATPPDIHEWISFDEVDEQRTWVFDATYLRSNYTCIFGCGCKGILDEPAPELGLGCCNFGAHLVDDEDRKNLDEHVARLEPRHMQFHARRRTRKKGYLQPGDPDGDGNPTTLTRLVEHDGVEACIFLNRPGFAGGAGCALHIAALEAGERPHGLEAVGVLAGADPARTLDGRVRPPHVTAPRVEAPRLGRGRADFGWWCTDTPDAFVGAEPLYVSAKDDIVELVGARVYDQMVELLERPGWVPVPHPVRRRS